MKNIGSSFIFLLTCIISINISKTHSYLHFVEFGDWGVIHNTYIQKAVAAAMNEYANGNHIDFIVSLGDNFYEDGVDTVRSERFQTSFTDIYLKPYYNLKVNWYFIAGNHDHVGNVEAQVAYSNKFSLWNFPDTFYIKSFNISNHTTLSLVMIDTTQLCNLYHTSLVYDILDSRMYEKLIKLLDSSVNSTYILVQGHHPMYSISRETSTCLNKYLNPLLIKYNVNAYISGHDHNFQHIYDSSNEINYFISGAGGKLHHSLSNEIPKNVELKLYWDGYQGNGIGGFLAFNVTDENIQFKFITTTNAVINSGFFKPRVLRSLICDSN